MNDLKLALELKKAGFWEQRFLVHRNWSRSDYAWLPCDRITKDDREKLWLPNVQELLKSLPMRLKRHPKLVNDAHFFLTKLVSENELYWAYYEGESGEGVLKDLSFQGELADVLARLWLAVNERP